MNRKALGIVVGIVISVAGGFTGRRRLYLTQQAYYEKIYQENLYANEIFSRKIGIKNPHLPRTSL